MDAIVAPLQYRPFIISKHVNMYHFAQSVRRDPIYRVPRGGERELMPRRALMCPATPHPVGRDNAL